MHSKPTLGYLLEGEGRRIAYLTDTVGLPPATQCIEKVKAELGVLTHVGHTLDTWLLQHRREF